MKTFDEIIQSFLMFLLRRNDLLDLKTTSIIRSLLDSIANELAVVNSDIDHVSIIQSILNATEMTIDELDSLAANFGVNRKEATFATTEITYYLTREAKSNITIPSGTMISTTPDSRSSASVSFISQESATFFADRMNAYFNPISGVFEVSVPAVALTPGTMGNVAPNSLTLATGAAGVNGEIVLCTNKIAATGGVDQESNEDFAARIFVSISGINVGTKDGYKSSALATPGVLDAIVVGAGDQMMVRDFNSLGEHIGGRVDVYIQGQTTDGARDRYNFLLQSKLGQAINLIEGSDLNFYVPDAELEKYPLVTVDRVYTVIENPILDFESQLTTPDPNLSDEIYVTIVAPLGGSTVNGGFDVLVRAFKPDGNITLVNLIINEETVNKMYYDTDRGFYKFTLNTLQFPDGVIQLKAEAYDELYKKAVTNPVLVTVRNLEDISVRILTPDAGVTISKTETVSAYAFSKAGITSKGVEIRYNEGRWVPMNATTTSTRFTQPLVAAAFPSGQVKIEVRAKDKKQRTAYSLPRYVIVENNADAYRDDEVKALSLRSEFTASAASASAPSSRGYGSCENREVPCPKTPYPCMTSRTPSTNAPNLYLAAGGNHNMAYYRLTTTIVNGKIVQTTPPADAFYHIPFYDDIRVVETIISHAYTVIHAAQEWAGTDGVGIAIKESAESKYWSRYINTGNTLLWPGDIINQIKELPVAETQDVGDGLTTSPFLTFVCTNDKGFLCSDNGTRFILETLPIGQNIAVTCVEAVGGRAKVDFMANPPTEAGTPGFDWPVDWSSGSDWPPGPSDWPSDTGTDTGSSASPPWWPPIQEWPSDTSSGSGQTPCAPAKAWW